MPRVALTAAQRRKNATEQVKTRFGHKLGLYCALYELTEKDVCVSIGMSQGTFIARKKNPDDFRVAEIKALCDVLHWSREVCDYIWYSGSDPDQLSTSDKRTAARQELNVI